MPSTKGHQMIGCGGLLFIAGMLLLMIFAAIKVAS